MGLSGADAKLLVEFIDAAKACMQVQSNPSSATQNKPGNGSRKRAHENETPVPLKNTIDRRGGNNSTFSGPSQKNEKRPSKRPRVNDTPPQINNTPQHVNNEINWKGGILPTFSRKYQKNQESDSRKRSRENEFPAAASPIPQTSPQKKIVRPSGDDAQSNTSQPGESGELVSPSFAASHNQQNGIGMAGSQASYCHPTPFPQYPPHFNHPASSNKEDLGSFSNLDMQNPTQIKRSYGTYSEDSGEKDLMTGPTTKKQRIEPDELSSVQSSQQGTSRRLLNPKPQGQMKLQEQQMVMNAFTE